MSAMDWLIEPGDSVLLEHHPKLSQGVPKRLHRTWGTVLKANPTTLDVQTVEGPRRVTRRCVHALTRSGFEGLDAGGGSRTRTGDLRVMSAPR